ncbi:MAG: hypothetical protein WKF96_00245 [Solirubrobacteraceae bacterium]
MHVINVRATGEHFTRGKTRKPYWQGVCSCGWAGRSQERRGYAEVEAAQHASGQSPVLSEEEQEKRRKNR